LPQQISQEDTEVLPIIRLNKMYMNFEMPVRIREIDLTAQTVKTIAGQGNIKNGIYEDWGSNEQLTFEQIRDNTPEAFGPAANILFEDVYGARLMVVKNNYLYFSGHWSNIIRKIDLNDPNYTVSHVFGSGGTRDLDGNGKNASAFQINAFAVDSKGWVWIHTGFSILRVVKPNGDTFSLDLRADTSMSFTPDYGETQVNNETSAAWLVSPIEWYSCNMYFDNEDNLWLHGIDWGRLEPQPRGQLVKKIKITIPE